MRIAGRLIGAGAIALGLWSGLAAAGERPATAIVPLKIVQLDGGGFKVGIPLRLGGGALRLYTFDTGSSGLYAAFNPVWWPFFVPVDDKTITQSYGDGVTFKAGRVLTTVGIPSDVGEIEAEVEVALITDAFGGQFGPPDKSTWLEDVAAGRPPLFGHFFGDFGAGLREKDGLFAVLPQLPGNLSSGFAVRLGCGRLTPATLVLGLTAGIRSSVTSWVPMRGKGAPPFPHSGWPTYAQDLIAAEFFLEGDATAYAFSTDAILDTGAPTTGIHESGEVKIPEALLERRDDPTRVRPGVQFRVTADGTTSHDGFELELLTGELPGFNRIDVTQADGEAFVNLGLIPFFRNDVVFDVERGLVGFIPCGVAGSERP